MCQHCGEFQRNFKGYFGVMSNLKERLRSYSNKDKNKRSNEIEENSQDKSNTISEEEFILQQKAAASTSSPKMSSKGGVLLNEEDFAKNFKDFSQEKWLQLVKSLFTTLQEVNLKLEGTEGTFDTNSESQTNLPSIATRLDALEDKSVKEGIKFKIMLNIIIAQDEKIQNMQQEILLLKKQKAKKNLIIEGLLEQEKETRTELISKVKTLFKESMEMPDSALSVVKVVNAFRQGVKGARERNVVIKLEHAEQKFTVLKYAKNLKGKTNPKKQLIFVKEDLDPEAAERRNYLQMLRKENNALDEEDEKKLTQLKIYKDNIIANNEPVVKHIHSPQVADMLRMTDEEIQEVRAVKVVAAEEHTEKGSEYYTYVQKVKTSKEVQKGLLKIRLKHGDATHVSVGYRLDGATGPYRQEGHDDKEYGAGRTILKVLKQKELVNIAVFVVRYYGGVKLGGRRYKILESLTEASLITYQRKAKERRTRQFRANSQDSIQSNYSALSYQEGEPDEGNAPENATEEQF